MDVIIKKIRRTRSLAEILSDSGVNMEPKGRSSPVHFATLKDIEKEKTGSDRNNNAGTKATIKRKSERLSDRNKRQCSNESTPEKW